MTSVLVDALNIFPDVNELKKPRDFEVEEFINELLLGMRFKAAVIIPKPEPIANKDLAIPCPSNSEILDNADDNKVTAAAIPRRDVTFMPLVKD